MLKFWAKSTLEKDKKMNWIIEKAHNQICANCQACIREDWHKCRAEDFRKCPFRCDMEQIEIFAEDIVNMISDLAEEARFYGEDFSDPYIDDWKENGSLPR